MLYQIISLRSPGYYTFYAFPFGKTLDSSNVYITIPKEYMSAFNSSTAFD